MVMPALAREVLGRLGMKTVSAIAAAKLLKLAFDRAIKGRRPVGIASVTLPSGTEVSAMYDQRTEMYDVGTLARSHAQGDRKAVKAALETLLAA